MCAVSGRGEGKDGRCGHVGVHVGRDRFLPVKRTSDLLLLMSDRYRLDPDDGRLSLNTSHADVPLLNLDAAYFDRVSYRRVRHGTMCTQVADALERMPDIPSMRNAHSLTIVGDVHFGANVTINVSFKQFFFYEYSFRAM